jgi:hypothetical protein
VLLLLSRGGQVGWAGMGLVDGAGAGGVTPCPIKIRTPAQDFTEVQYETLIGAWTLQILCSFRPCICAYLDTVQ